MPSHTTTQSAARRRPHKGRRALSVARILVGLFFISAGLPKLTDHAVASAQFAHWHVPLHAIAAYGIGGLEVVGGALLALGVLTRPLALLLLADMIGALTFAGTTDGGQHIVLPLLLGSLSALIARYGAGRRSEAEAVDGDMAGDLRHRSRRP